jgi:hypothetical protein
MSARALLLTSMLSVGSLAFAADEDVPELEFFEYLGMWEESDEEWLVLDDLVTAENDARPDSAPEREKSVENDDES